MQVGDIVRYLNAVGGGTVTKVLNENLVEIHDESGFDMPVRVQELVLVERPNTPKKETVAKTTQSFTETVEEVEDEEIEGNDNPHLFVAFVRNAKDFEYYTNGAKIWSGTKAGDGNDLQYIKGATSLKYQVGGTAGYTDEIRILNIAPSEEYIKAEYDSINNKQFVVASEAVKNGYGLKIIVR